jgi:hypothetical protein
VVSKLTRLRKSSLYEPVRSAAQACLPYLEARADQSRQEQTLLRPSAQAGAAPTELLRPAETSDPGTSPAELLRANVGGQDGVGGSEIVNDLEKHLRSRKADTA